MRRAGLLAVALVATIAPGRAGAEPVAVTRTIVAPTTFGSSSGILHLPSVVAEPTNPYAWHKYDVDFRRARCAYLKAADVAQDERTGKAGYVFTLPEAFGLGDSFTLRDASGLGLDFDVAFYSSLGACLADVEIQLGGIPEPLVIPVEGPGPQPRGCAEEVDRDRLSVPCFFTRIGDDAGTLRFNANHAVVVMPAGANAMFTLTLTYD